MVARGWWMKAVRPFLAALVLGFLAQPAFAFQQTQGSGEQESSAVEGAQTGKPTVEPGKGLNLSGSGISIGKSNGTEVRIPGIGSVGVLPKLDFGLELLYGANDNKLAPDDKAEPNDVQIRGTIKHRF
jgi:hypothetical protein